MFCFVILFLKSIHDFLLIHSQTHYFEEEIHYDVTFKHKLNSIEALDSVHSINTNITNIGKVNPRLSNKFAFNNEYFIGYFWIHTDSTISLSSYDMSDTFRTKYNLKISKYNRNPIYGIRSNYEATKAVQDAFETEVLPLFASEFHQISPVRDKAWWIKRDFQVLYFPIGSFVLACVFIPILACALRRNADKIRAIKAEQNKSRKEE